MPPDLRGGRSRSRRPLQDRPCRRLLVLSISTAPGTAEEHLGTSRSGREGCDCNRDRGDQYRVPHQARREERVATDRERKADRPHEAQRLQDVMPYGDVGNVSQRADFVIENEIPRMNDIRADSFEDDMATLTLSGKMVFMAMTDRAQTN